MRNACFFGTSSLFYSFTRSVISTSYRLKSILKNSFPMRIHIARWKCLLYYLIENEIFIPKYDWTFFFSCTISYKLKETNSIHEAICSESHFELYKLNLQLLSFVSADWYEGGGWQVIVFPFSSIQFNWNIKQNKK